ncbi:MAG: response regulator [Burkholderiales bacterium]|jgi:twitching motility two-component system response regulator PilH
MSRKILIIDDSPTQRQFLSELLLGRGYAVITADNGADGLVRARAERPDLILMDVVMPGASGFRATRDLSRDPETSDIPVVVCSTKAEPTDRIWALRQGARDYLVKPVQPDELLACVAGLVN